MTAGPAWFAAFAATIGVFGTLSAGCLGAPPVASPDQPPPDLTLTPGAWSNGLLEIAVDLMNTANATPNILAYLARSSSGMIFFNGTSGTGAEVNATRVTIAFEDLDNSGLVSDGDRILVSVEPATSAALRGGSLEVRVSPWPGHEGEVIGRLDALP